MKLRVVGGVYKPQKQKRKLFVDKGAGKARREKKKEKTAQKTAIRVVRGSETPSADLKPACHCLMQPCMMSTCDPASGGFAYLLGGAGR